MKFYKYLPTEFAASLVESGGTRIGTLTDFRRAELGAGIADADEGKKTVFAYLNGVYEHGAPEANALMQIGFAPPPGARYEFVNCTSEQTHEFPNSFVWCCSRRLSKRILREFEGADACVEILRIDRFLAELTKELRKHYDVHFFGFGPVKYRSREEIWNHTDLGHNPAFIKPQEFYSQHEFRAVWTVPEGVAIEAKIIQSSGASEFCRLYSF
ncbi:hypothetical protein [Pandoraea sputorum]|uniref:hypothetical protein n=1 Tax=Pandoraea sputorum TaxID=93222 RepID=UPI001240C368|nr:hypothetical protein [Pandoraea sputorum]